MANLFGKDKNTGSKLVAFFALGVMIGLGLCKAAALSQPFGGLFSVAGAAVFLLSLAGLIISILMFVAVGIMESFRK